MSEMYTAHCVVCDPPPVGLIMREMLPEERKLFICPLQEHDVNNLPNDLYGQVGLMHMFSIHHKVFECVHAVSVRNYDYISHAHLYAV